MIDLAARALAIRDAARAKGASDRDRNRREMPETAVILDGTRGVFGPPQWFRFTENGRTVEYGKPIEYTRAVQASGKHGRRK